MSLAELETIQSSVPAPWDAPCDGVERWLRARLRFDAAQLWLIRGDRPNPDALLVCIGFGAPGVRAWSTAGHARDHLSRRAEFDGVATGSLAECAVDDRCVCAGSRALVAIHADHAESATDRLHWRLLLARTGEPYSTAEQEAAAAVLALWQASFNSPVEPGLTRMLLGHDERLILADPACMLRLMSAGVAANRLIEQVRQIRQQRWPESCDDASHDLVIELAGAPFWVVFRRRRAVGLPEADHWLLAIRPLESGELPAVGRLADDRLGRAIAFIHDRFSDGPTLADIARHVHVSPFHFHRLFTRGVGVSPKHYLQMKQMQAARWRLRSERTPIARIAVESGFSSHGHFTATFQRVVGVSPTAYRLGAGR